MADLDCWRPRVLSRDMSMPRAAPCLEGFRLYKVVQGIPAWDGTLIAELRGAFYRRDADDGRVQTVAQYTVAQDADEHEPAFVAWGYVDERHCRFNAVAREGGGWYDPRRGCPSIHPLWVDGHLTGFTVATPEGVRTFGRHPSGFGFSAPTG